MVDGAGSTSGGRSGDARATALPRPCEVVPGGPTCRYWLAQLHQPEQGLGTIELKDGCHGSPEGVAKAAKLYSRIFGDEGPWVMVKVEPLPDLDPPINEQAAGDCARLVAGEFQA